MYIIVILVYMVIARDEQYRFAAVFVVPSILRGVCYSTRNF
jgi:hypothetical protein